MRDVITIVPPMSGDLRVITPRVLSKVERLAPWQGQLGAGIQLRLPREVEILSIVAFFAGWMGDEER